MTDLKSSRRLSWGHVTVLAAAAACFGLLNWHLADRSLWIDEYDARLVGQGSLGQVIQAAAVDIHPPLYFLFLHGWTAAAGSGDFSLRWLSTAFAVLAVPLLAVTGRRLFDRSTGAVAAVALAVAPALIEFGRMARYYSLLVALGLLSTWLLLTAVRRNGWAWWAAYALSGAALLYTFYPTAGLLLAQAGLVWFWPARRGPAIRRWLIAAAAMALAFLPMLMTAAAQRVVTVAGAPGADLSRSVLGFVLGLAASGYTFGVGETLFPWNPAAWLGLAAVVALLVSGARPPTNRSFWLCAGCAAVCLAFMSLTTTFVSVGTPFLNVPVRGLFALPFFLLCLAAGLVRLGSQRVQLAFGGALIVVWAVSLANDYRGEQFLNPIYLTPAREAAAWISRQAESGDLVISDFDSVVNYYLPPAQPDGPPSLPRVTTEDEPAIEAALANGPSRVWLVTLGRDATERGSNADSVRQLLSVRYALDQSQGLLQIDPTYRRVKDLILRRTSYEYRLTIELYRRRSP